MHMATNLQKLLKSILKKKLDSHICPVGHQLPSLEATTVAKFSCILSDISSREISETVASLSSTQQGWLRGSEAVWIPGQILEQKKSDPGCLFFFLLHAFQV